MAAEAKLQKVILDWLKINKVYCIKTQSGPGTPLGCPDIIGLYRGKWLAIEVKSSLTAVFQPGQRLTIQTLQRHNPFVYVATPENWASIKATLVAEFF